jgi:hypothetical protein
VHLDTATVAALAQPVMRLPRDLELFPIAQRGRAVEFLPRQRPVLRDVDHVELHTAIEKRHPRFVLRLIFLSPTR